jgi:PAS domain S-box-containing protein
MIHMSEKPTYEELLKRVLEFEKAELENKLNSEALHRSQVMLTRTERIAHIGSWEWDISTDKVTWSEELFRIFQLDPDEKVPSWAEHSALYHPEDMERLRHAVEASVADGTPYEQELRALRKDGEIRVCLAYGFAETGPDGRAIRLFGSLQDITERKQAEEAMRESEDIFRTLSDLAPSGIYLCDPKGNCRYANPRWCEMAGLSLEEALGDGWTKGLHPEDRDYIFSNWQRMVESEGQRGFEYRFQTPTGKVTWVYGLATPQRNALGNIVAYIGINTDITERKEAEDTLLQITDRLDLALQAAKAGAWDWDILAGHIEWSAKMFDIFGFNPLKNVASFELWESILHPQDLEISKSRIAQALEKQATLDSNYRIVLPDGQIRWINAVGKGQYDEQSRPIRMIGICIDITERKQAEEALLRTKYILSEGQRIAHVGTFEYIFDTGETVWSDEEYRIYGFESEGLSPAYDEMLAKCIHPDDSELLHKAFSAALQSGTVYELEHRIVRPDGSVRWVYDLAHPYFDDTGKLIRYIGTTLDITDRKNAEKAKAEFESRLLQMQKMESIGSLAGGIAHDLNNILFPISGLSEILLVDIPPDNPGYENIEQIHKSAQRGSDLVKQILAFSRRSNPQKLPIRIQPILKEVLKLVRATIPMNIEITSIIKPECGMVSADPTQIHQIAMNLITNAFHAVEQTGGTINLELKETEFGRDDLYDNSIKAGKYACISISDTGTGIDQALMHKIFDPYFTTKELGKGTGLGLSVVHGISKEHGGDIRVYSEVGNGTTFNVYLPLLEDAKDSNPAAVTRKYPTGCESILLVDDEEPIIRMEQMMLERQGYHVTTRTSSLDALETFRANPSNFDIVISDRGMPNMTGEQLTMELISIRPNIPVILCTGFSDENDEKRGKAIGIKGFLKKPVARGDLAEMVRKVLDEVAEGERVNESGQEDIIVAKNTGTPGGLLKDQGNC